MRKAALFCIVILCCRVSFAQRTIDADKLLEKNHEHPTDPYLPNAYDNKKTTPSYKYNTPEGIRSGSSIFTRQVNVNALQQNIVGDAANEPSIAVNPLNPNSMAIGWRQFDNISSNFRQAGFGYTVDGGQTWVASKLDAGVFHSDPVLDYDAEGNFYYNSLLQSFSTRVYKSANGGSAWGAGVNARGGDKQWMSIDRTTGAGKGNIYSSWTAQYSTCAPGFFTRSTTGGASFESCTSVSGSPFFGTEAIGNNGELYLAGANTLNDDIVFVRSLNAKVAGSIITWSTPVYIFMDGYVGSTSANPAGLLGQVNIDVDRSGTPGADIIYVLASLERISTTDPADVMFSRSTDGGATWSAPVKVNDDNRNNIQWMAVMSTAPNGRIDAAWLDTRDAVSGSDSSALYYSYSLDAGATWTPNERLSELFNPHVGYPNQSKMGDYFDMVSDNNGAHLAWANTLNGGQDVYYSYIVPPVVTSTSDIKQSVICTLYPNPTNGRVTVISDASVTDVSVFNMLGESIYKIEHPQPKLEMDLSAYAKGVYFVRFSTPYSTVLKKLVRN